MVFYSLVRIKCCFEYLTRLVVKLSFVVIFSVGIDKQLSISDDMTKIILFTVNMVKHKLQNLYFVILGLAAL